MVQLKKIFKKLLLVNPFYFAQQRKIDWLLERVDKLEQAVEAPSELSGSGVDVRMIHYLLRSIGVNKSLSTVSHQDISDAIKRNLLKYTEHSFGGNHEITPNSEPRILFFHIPKTAGSSVHNELMRFYHPLSLYPERNLMTMEDTYGVPQVALNYGLKQQCFTNEAYLERFPPYLSRLVSGHFTFDLFKRYLGVFDFVTVLRDPAERLYSEFEYIKRDYTQRNLHNSYDIQKLNKQYGSPYFEDLTIVDFINDNPMTHHGYSDNLMARLLADDVDNSPNKLADSKHSASHYVDSALANLAHFKYIGFLSDLAAFDELMQNTYGFADFNVSHRKDNQAYKRKDDSQHAWQVAGFASKQACIEYIRQSGACAIDNQIYQRAYQLYGNKAAQHPVRVVEVDSKNTCIA